MQLIGEIILVAGKGHEEQQIYKNKILYISDKEIIKKLKIKIRNINKIKQNFIQNKLILSNVLGKIKNLILMVFQLIQDRLKKIIYF